MLIKLIMYACAKKLWSLGQCYVFFLLFSFFALLFWFESFQCLLFKSLSDHVTEHFDDAP